MRHQPFAIGQKERDAWLRNMTAAVDSLHLAAAVRKALLDYFETPSTAMINQPPPSYPPASSAQASLPARYERGQTPPSPPPPTRSPRRSPSLWPGAGPRAIPSYPV